MIEEFTPESAHRLYRGVIARYGSPKSFVFSSTNVLKAFESYRLTDSAMDGAIPKTLLGASVEINHCLPPTSWAVRLRDETLVVFVPGNNQPVEIPPPSKYLDEMLGKQRLYFDD